LTLAGIDTQLASLPETVKMGLSNAKKQGARISDADYQLMLSSVDEAMVPAKMKGGISAELIKTLNDKEIKVLLKWYESDLGKEITAAESAGTKPDAFMAMQKQAPQLLTDTKRVEFAQRVDALVGATDMMLDMQVNNGFAVYSAISAVSPSPLTLSAEQIKNQMSAQMAPMRANIAQMVALAGVYSFKNISLDKLAKYENFLSTNEALKFSKITMNALMGGFETAITKLAKILAANQAKQAKTPGAATSTSLAQDKTQ
jgi:hypothetical protein